jgi:LmbE family N-acetylglucosaminyl deacetylase
MSDLHVFLSPHLDDAVLSCGGMTYQLALAGEAVQVITIFAGDPPPGLLTSFAQSLHDRWQADVADRRDEDHRALRMLGAEAIHWTYPDAIYRRDPVSGAALYDSEGAIFGEVSEADAALIDSIAARLRSVASAARLYVPLTAGRHVDHQIVRTAAAPSGRELIYYEEYPYVESPGELARVLATAGWSAEIIPLNEEAIRAKTHAVLAYRSQMSTFFAGAGEMEQRVRAYADRVGDMSGPAERVWRIARKRRAIVTR